MKPILWRLKKGAERRFKSGHPWVYSNELSESPKGIKPGDPIELRDAGGKFLARGYGNPHSLIAFRAVTRDPEVFETISEAFLFEALSRALNLRKAMGLTEVSHRLCFGEADFLPGLVIDRYLGEESEVFVIQAHTAGADRWSDVLIQVFERLFGPTLNHASIILRNDLNVRKLEGLPVAEGAQVLKSNESLDLFLMRAGSPASPTHFYVDLLKGQKTGFFLDQAANISTAAERFWHLGSNTEPIKILDLFCYVGQWGVRLASALKNKGRNVQVTAVDSSARALELARKNLESQGVSYHLIQMDALKEELPDGKFDLVIADPPALIKSRKDVQAGAHAYLQLNTEAMRKLKRGSGIVSCSCSGLLEEERFLQILSKASHRAEKQVQWIARGGQSPDHPMLVEFPEGRYLKSWMGIV